jgi:hypothetical protein
MTYIGAETDVVADQAAAWAKAQERIAEPERVFRGA